MGLNFPDIPTAGQIFGNYQYWMGTGWRRYDITARRRNRIVNGAMLVSQENGNTAIAVNGYPVDQWNTSVSGGMVLTAQRVQVNTPNGSANRVRLTVTTAKASLAAADHARIMQKLEGVNIADFSYNQPGLTGVGQQSVLRFGFKGPAGTYSISLHNSDHTRSFVGIFTIAAGSANIDTEQVFVIPGDTTGTWLVDNGVGIYLYIIFASGTTYQGSIGWQAGNRIATAAVSNGVAVAGAVYELFDAGLYLDPDNTGVPPKWEPVDEGAETLACQRYWYFASATSPGGGNSATQTVRPGGRHPVPMRATPAVTIVGVPTYSDGTNCNVSAIAGNYSNAAWLEMNLTVVTGLTAGRPTIFWNGAIPTIGFAASARM